MRETELFAKKINFILETYNNKIRHLFDDEKKFKLNNDKVIIKRIHIEDIEYQLTCMFVVLLREFLEQEIIKTARIDNKAVKKNKRFDNEKIKLKTIIKFYKSFDINVEYEELRILSNTIKHANGAHANGAYKELAKKYPKYIKTPKNTPKEWPDMDYVDLYDNTLLDKTLNLSNTDINRLGKMTITTIETLNKERHSKIYN